MSETDTQTYEGKNLKVSYKSSLCMHAGECGGSGLRGVFSKEKWITPDGAGVEQLVDVIERCPSSALKYERLDGASQEAPELNSISPHPNSALYVRGDVKLSDNQGNVISEEMRLALCRCGQSDNKPFCDGSHAKAEFKDEGKLGESRLETKAMNTLGKLEITPSNNGPLMLKGDFVLRSADNSGRVYGEKAALCRCGASQNKPFCDGKHNEIGFKG